MDESAGQDARRRRALAEMLDAVELSPQEITRLAVRARDAAYWAALAPDIPIGGAAPEPGPVTPDAEATLAAEHLRRDRYFFTPQVFTRAAISELNRAVDAVRAAGWPPVFTLLYDPFWAAVRHPFIAYVAASRLGAGYLQIPHGWVHVVPALDGALGWMPHFDGLRRRRLTIWMALTDATMDNGCIHLIPPDALPESFRTNDVDATVPMRDVQRAMHATRALPAPAGSVLGWDHDVFHWGGRASAPQSERRSISLELIAAGEPPLADETPLIDLSGPLPAFATRLAVVAGALTNYGAREASFRRFRALAPHLLSERV